MSLTRIYLIRHGATILTAEDRFAGATNVPLSDEGRRQATLLGERLSHVNLDAIYASPLDRTMETARLIAAPHQLEINPVEGLKEISHGRWEQHTREEVESLYRAEAAAWDEDPFTFAPEGGESGLEVTARALPALMNIVKKHDGQAVAIISHKATIRLLLSSLLGFDPRRYRDNLDQDPAALNIIDFRGPVKARLELFNDTTHYTGVGCLIKPDAPQPRLSKWWSN